MSSTSRAYVPTSAFPPGETLRETLEALDMSQADLAVRTGYSQKHISQVMKGAVAITPDTAIALERVTNVPARMWTALDAQYQEHKTRGEQLAAFAAHSEWLKRVPTSLLRKQGYVTAGSREIGEQLEQVLRFFKVANLDAWSEVWGRPAAAFLKSNVFDADPVAVATWLRLGEIAAEGMRSDPFDRTTLRALLPSLRALTTQRLDVFLPRMQELCATAGVAVVVVKEVPGSRVSGAARWLSPGKAVIQLSARYKRNDHLWFSFFHETAHLLLHSKRDDFIDDLHRNRKEVSAGAQERAAGGTGSSLQEDEANRFAADLLIPPRFGNELVGLRTLDEVVSFAERIDVAPGIVVGRLHHDQLLDYRIGQKLFERYMFVE
jgi:HTH-type transcriptional regulator/antitoxin HigA